MAADAQLATLLLELSSAPSFESLLSVAQHTVTVTAGHMHAWLKVVFKKPGIP